MSKPVVRLLYLADAKFGGWPTFTYHLAEALRSAGARVVVRTLGARTSSTPIDFGHGLVSRRMSERDLQMERLPTIISAADPKHAEEASRFVARGARLVVHDPAEKHLSSFAPSSVVVIRQTMYARMPEATFIQHPYVRSFPRADRVHRCISQARIDFDKHTDILLDANDRGANIAIFGAPNRLYVHFKLASRWPSFSPEPFAKTRGAGAMLCASGRAAVDMSAIKFDGGGSQYSFMEAWDAETPLIINRKWVDGIAEPEMRDGQNCLIAGNGSELASALDRLEVDSALRRALVAGGIAGLEAHDCARIGAEYMRLLRL